MGVSKRIGRGLTHVLRGLWRAGRNERAAVSPLMALMIIPIVGVLGLAGETGIMYFMQRSVQNAADTAALAAATNNCREVSCAVNYQQEAAAVARRYGFQNGVSNATVATSYSTCPAGAASCYYVDITKVVPIALTRVVGFQGSQALGAGRGQMVSARAVASTRVDEAYCVIALGSGNQSILMNGNQSLGGCDTYTFGTARCNGSSFGIDTSNVAGNNAGGCGSVANNTGVTLSATDAAYLQALNDLSNNTNIPAPSGCLSGASATFSGTTPIDLSNCYTGNVTINGGAHTTINGQVLRIYGGGNLIVNSGASLSSNALTIVFTGDAGHNAPGFFSGGGTLDFAAPTSGTWSGVAVYQDTRMTRQTNHTYTGNSPAFNITGAIYGKFLNLDFRGAINKHTGGYSCISLIVNTMSVSGGALFGNTTTECRQAGYSGPTSTTILTRQALIQ